MARIIPSTMATQHPDNAAAPYWQASGDPFITTAQELQDLLESFKNFGISEYMWDWEGKYADAAVIDKLLATELDYFRSHPLGKDKFVTFRVPNVWQEKGYTLMQALSVYLSAEDLARDLDFKHRPLFELILPMTESADQLLHMHDLFDQLASFKNKVFTSAGLDNTEQVEVIPLVESVASQQGVGGLLRAYAKGYSKKYGQKLSEIRPFLACSDPAMVSGWLATLLANKEALSQVYEFGRELQVDVNPIAGAGSLPFRGGLSPESPERFIETYGGVRTVSIQSSFRYDHPVRKVKSALDTIHTQLPKSEVQIITDVQQKIIRHIAASAEKYYQQTLRGLISEMQPFFNAVPSRRERRLHIGLLAYDRNMKGQKLPRAIKFTSAFYSLGVPPEFIGLGRALAELSDTERAVLNDIIPNLAEHVKQAGFYINKDNLLQLVKNNAAWRPILEDITLTETYFNTLLEPATIAQKSHIHATANVLLLRKNPAEMQRYIVDAALLRKSLG